MTTKLTMIALFAFAVSLNAFSFDPAQKFKTACLACHSIGGGDKIGPDLKGLSAKVKAGLKEHNKKDASDKEVSAWIVKFVKYPEGMIKGDPEEKGYEKPDNYAKHLFAKYKTLMTEQDMPEADIVALVKWIDSQK